MSNRSYNCHAYRVRCNQLSFLVIKDPLPVANGAVSSVVLFLSKYTSDLPVAALYNQYV